MKDVQIADSGFYVQLEEDGGGSTTQGWSVAVFHFYQHVISHAMTLVIYDAAQIFTLVNTWLTLFSQFSDISLRWEYQ